MTLKIIKSTIFAGVLIAIAVISMASKSNFSRAANDNGQASPFYLHAAASDLEKAGFTNIQPAQPNGTRFTGPADYFMVKDSVGPASEALNIVMVYSAYYSYTLPDKALFSYGSDSHSLDISGGKGKEATIADNRIAVNLIKGSNYTVIIGPNKQKIEALAAVVAGKIK